MAIRELKSDWHKLVPVISSGHLPSEKAHLELSPDKRVQFGDQIFLILEAYRDAPDWYLDLCRWADVAYHDDPVSMVCIDPDGSVMTALNTYNW